jgi:hypothetical protein
VEAAGPGEEGQGDQGEGVGEGVEGEGERSRRGLFHVGEAEQGVIGKKDSDGGGGGRGDAGDADEDEDGLESLGRLALLLKDWPAAEAHLTAALSESRSLGSPPFQAMARFDLARLHDLRRAPGDARLAATHRDEALREATRLGA